MQLLLSANTFELAKWCPTELKCFKVPKKQVPPLSRLVVDATPLNRVCFRPPKMPILDMSVFVRECTNANFVQTIDIVSFFYQVPICLDIRKFFGARFNRSRGKGSLVWLKRLCMGWTWSPFIAQTISNIVAKCAVSKCRHVIKGRIFAAPWLDNFVVASELEEDLEVMKHALDSAFSEFNIITHPWSSDCAVLGLEYFRAQEGMCAKHTTEFLQKFESACCLETFSCEDVARATGCAIWVTQVRGILPCLLPNTIATLQCVATKIRACKNWDADFQVDENTRSEWVRILQIAKRSFKRERIEENDTVWASDATEECIAITCGSFSAAEFTQHTQIFVNELCAAVWAMDTAVASQCKTVTLLVDNAGVIGAIRHGHSHVCVADSMLGEFFAHTPSSVAIRTLHVCSANNPTDKFSRGAEVDNFGEKNSFKLVPFL